ncbi:MAG TPA: hypothetical protein VFY73_06820 [Ideonella sp.]|uniref:hypothetical protein n=1 Tax=Ideonella sp. TaxID=1929293 RepID=UPI002E33A301|nr:hypothetical protein [Ideonella sp.]HEX5683732.1 hypothetical protein [Ideonella sp.]
MIAAVIPPSRPRLQGVGGLAACFVALAYVVGFAGMATLLNPPGSVGSNPSDLLAFLLDKKLLFQLWMVLIYVLAGGALVVLSVSLHERLKDGFSDQMQIATPFGLIWAGLVIASGMVAISGLESVADLRAKDANLAVFTWVSVGTIQNALGGGIEVVGGVWMLLVSVALVRWSGFSRALGWYGVLIGAVGVLTVVPPLKELTTVFGLGQIPWFAWMGAAMLRPPGRPGVMAAATSTPAPRS